MKRAIISAVVLMVAFTSFAAAETWRAKVVPVPGRVTQCEGVDVSKIIWDFTLEGGTLAGSSNQGAKFSTPVAADGKVNVTYEGRLGANAFLVQVTGNAKTKELQSLNVRANCLFRFVPTQ